jgi:outer membrane immunogenic protein
MQINPRKYITPDMTATFLFYCVNSIKSVTRLSSILRPSPCHRLIFIFVFFYNVICYFLFLNWPRQLKIHDNSYNQSLKHTGQCTMLINKKMITTTLLGMALLPALALAEGSFEGFYAGTQLGYHDGKDKGTEYDTGVASDYTQTTEPSGASLGIFGGYNKLVTPSIVLGIEASIDSRSQDDSSPQKDLGVPDLDYLAKIDIRSAWSLQARLGRIINEQTLLYVTGGFAGARIQSSFCDVTVPECESHSDSENGWIAGLGIEHLLTDYLSIKAGYSYADYGSRDVSTAVVYGDGYYEKQEYTEHSFQVGLAYHF